MINGSKIGVAAMTHCLKTLSDPTRLVMMKLFLEEEYCVCQLVDMFEMSQPAISQHLRKLKNAGFLNEDRRGQWRYYSINSSCPEFDTLQFLLLQIDQDDELLKHIKQKETQSSCQ